MICHSCHTEFDDYKSLALHIMTNKKGHKKGRMWASKFLAQVNKKEFSPRTPMSEETKQTIKECVRVISGECEIIRAVCPTCKTIHNQKIEVEYLQDRERWCNSLGTLIINCQSCRSIG